MTKSETGQSKWICQTKIYWKCPRAICVSDLLIFTAGFRPFKNVYLCELSEKPIG